MKHLIRLLAGVLMALPAWSQNLVGLKGLLPSAVDYRPFQSPVKNQASRGTCVAFSVAAVLETFDGVPSDLSEQGAYAYIKLQELGAGEVFRGGMLGNYPELLAKVGFMHESVAPYDPKAGLWSKSDHVLKQYLEEGKTGVAALVKRAGTTRYQVRPENVTYLEGPAAADVATLKRLLVDGHQAIAVGYTRLYTPYWSRYKSGILAPGEGFLYSVDGKSYSYNAAKTLRPRLAQEIAAGKIKVVPADDSPKGREHYGGHAVTVVGYTTNGFLIKNSWGQDWGMNGYGLVSYDYHRIFCDEALALKQADVLAQPVDDSVRPVIYLKTRPHRDGDRVLLTLSLFGPRQGGLPGFKTLRYQVFEQKSDGTRGVLLDSPTPSVRALVGIGYPTDVLAGQPTPVRRADEKYWVQVTFNNGGESMERILTFPNVTWSNNEYRGY